MTAEEERDEYQDDLIRVLHERNEAVARINLAIAELEKAKPGLLLTGVASWHVDRALGILKGEAP